MDQHTAHGAQHGENSRAFDSVDTSQPAPLDRQPDHVDRADLTAALLPAERPARIIVDLARVKRSVSWPSWFETTTTDASDTRHGFNYCNPCISWSQFVIRWTGINILRLWNERPQN